MEISEMPLVRPDDPSAGPTAHEDDLLWQHLKSLPAFRALLRAVEARFYQHLEIPGPILDLGCGDGHFAAVTFDRPLRAGIDPWWGPLQKAQRTDAYQLLSQSMGDQLPFPDHHFGSVISNSVLEHIPDIQPVLDEASRVTRPGGTLVITMPSHYFTRYLSGARFFERLGSRGLADRYRHFFNRISRHQRTDSAEKWAARLATAGFAVERWQYYFSQEALRALEWGHVQGLPSAVLHALTGHWIVAPWQSNLRYTERWLRPYYEEEAPPDGTYVLMVARKQADGPIDATLPPPQPFTQAELASPIRETQAVPRVRPFESVTSPTTELLPEPAPLPAFDDDEDLLDRSQPPSRIGRAFVPLSLAALSLLSAVLGQSILSSYPPEPTPGLRWYATALLALLGLVWYRRRSKTGSVRLPDWRSLPRRRWGILLAAFLAILANAQVTGPIPEQQPGAALAIWLIAITVGLYALWPMQHQRSPSDLVTALARSWRPLAIALLLFVAALVVRLILLSQHPFILNGVEASIGLDGLAVTRGQLRNPFSTAWLTNPTFPLFLLALPLRLLGPSAIAVRLPSAIAGALTIPAVYLFGRRLWSHQIGLIAAIFLAGSHFHLHYSRLGMTNIWDPLLVLLALGLLLNAWQRDADRPAWLVAGLAVGANAYFYTSSHLLPLMLLALLVHAALFNGDRLRAQWRGLLAAGLLALVVALPQLLYYNANWSVFMERANMLAITRNGQLPAMVAQTGQTAGAVLGQQFKQAALAFNYSLDNDTSYNPGIPLLRFWPAVFFVLGLGVAILRLRSLRHMALLVWVIVTIVFAGALLENPPVSHRLVIVTPALALLAAIGLVGLSRWVMEAWHSGTDMTDARPGQRYLLLTLVVLALLITLGDIGFYFGRYQAEHRFGDRNTEAAHRLALYLQTLDEDWNVYFYGPPNMYVSFPTIPFLATNHTANVNLFDVPEAAGSLPAQPGEQFVVLFLPERAGELNVVQAAYPTGQLRQFSGVFADPLFLAYEVRR